MAGPPRNRPPVPAAKAGKREPPVLNLPRGNEALRNLEDPTYAFPIAGRQPGATKKRLSRGTSDDELFLGDPPVTAADEEEGEYPDLPARRPSIDARLVAVWLFVATLLAVLAALAAAAAVVYL